MVNEAKVKSSGNLNSMTDMKESAKLKEIVENYKSGQGKHGSLEKLQSMILSFSAIWTEVASIFQAFPCCL